MANHEKGEFDLVAGERTYTLTLKTAALMALESHFSTPDKPADLGQILERVNAGSVQHAVVFLWACLRKYHPEITLDQTVAIIDDAGGLDGVTEQIAAVAQTTNPDPRDVQELGVSSRPRKAQGRRGTGETGTSRPVAVA